MHKTQDLLDFDSNSRANGHVPGRARDLSERAEQRRSSVWPLGERVVVPDVLDQALVQDLKQSWLL
jgi:hypothetical protein